MAKPVPPAIQKKARRIQNRLSRHHWSELGGRRLRLHPDVVVFNFGTHYRLIVGREDYSAIALLHHNDYDKWLRRREKPNA